MIISVAGLFAVVLPLLLGGRFSRLAHVQFKHVGGILAALGIQIVIIELLPGPQVLLRVAHLGTYAMAAWFLIANRRIPGLWLTGLGAALNGLAIVVNGGTLPAGASALRLAGMQATGERFMNSGILPHPRLAFLGDIFAIPAGFPLANVFSVGDVLIVLGASWTAFALLGTRWTRHWVPVTSLPRGNKRGDRTPRHKRQEPAHRFSTADWPGAKLYSR
jgi:hypothetical protein